MPVLLGLIIREAGKSAANAVAEVREAVDFLRYYADQARQTLAHGVPLGPIVCISPWNFPLAIFTGQVAAALVGGNPVLAKPAEETPLIAAEAVRVLHAAGIPAAVLQLVPGAGAVGAALVGAIDTAGVMFTGSTEVARLIQRQLAGRLSAAGQPIPLIAETGGQNAMIVDSSALAEQVVADVIASAFDSAGQRCSALRLLCLQDDVADRTLVMLKGAVAELSIGVTDTLATDIGPVITAGAQDGITSYIAKMREAGCKIDQAPLGPDTAHGTFVPPTIIELDDIAALGREVFGPVLHVVRFRAGEIDALVAKINATGYGLTFGLHTRLDETIERVTKAVAAGNLYVNRNIIGAVVGVQPFGGRGLSGTGPKAGGPLYLSKLVAPGSWSGGAAGGTPDAALTAFVDWLEARGDDTARQVAGYAARSRLGQQTELPGPVGERNLYALHPRGRIAAIARTDAALWRQIGAHEMPRDLPRIVTTRLDWSRDGLETAADLAAALIEGHTGDITAASQALAARDGAIVPLQAASGGDYMLDWLLEEVSTSINTTAAGGNASLMALA